MKKSGLETWLYSTLGVVAMLFIVIVVNAISARAKVRVDLTAEKAYTLSQGTRAILAKLDTPVQIRFYCTRGDNRMPVMLKTYAQRVEDLLGEYRQASKGLIEIQKLDPQPDSDAEDSAKLDGIEGAPLENGETVYLGISVSMLDQKEVTKFLSPDRERLLEYEISRAISRVMTTSKPVLGVMSPLPIQGQQMNPMMARMGGGRGQPAWAIYDELKSDYKVQTVEMTADKIPDEVKVLVLIHPKSLSDTAQYAIDQFLLRGGKLVAFLDPFGVLDRSAQGGPMGMSMGSTSSMDKLLKAWGLNFDGTKVVADMDFVGRTREGKQPAVLALTEKAINREDVITADADNLFFAFAGAITGTPVAGLKETVLLHSSKNAQLIDAMGAQFGGEKLIQDFLPTNTEYPLAVRITGKFKTAFPDGKPKAEEKPPTPGEKPEEKKPETPAEPGLKESKDETSVVIIGDSDFMQDQLAIQEAMTPFGQRIAMPANGNLAFAQAAIDQLTGDNNLIAIRSRASRERQFTVVKAMQAKAEASYQGKIKDLQKTLADAQAKINESQAQKTEKGAQRLILSPEQQAEKERAEKKVAETKLELKNVRKNLNADTASLENRTKWLNIAVMPALVAAAGVGLAVVRHQRRAAR